MCPSFDHIRLIEVEETAGNLELQCRAEPRMPFEGDDSIYTHDLKISDKAKLRGFEHGICDWKLDGQQFSTRHPSFKSNLLNLPEPVPGSRGR